jgi:hypothetical protein
MDRPAEHEAGADRLLRQALDITKEIAQRTGRIRDLFAQEKKLRKTQAPEREIAAVREQIVATERELVRLVERHAHAQLRPDLRARAEKLESASRRIRHVRVAAENLKAAEMHDLARQLLEEGRTKEVVAGFRSRAGKPFRARLVLNNEGKVEFDFPASARTKQPAAAE